MNRGEVWWVDFEPAVGEEITLRNPISRSMAA